MWMASVEGMSPTGAGGLGFLLPVANPKELALTIGAGLIIGGAGLPRAPTVSLALCYTVIGCLTVIVPIVAFVDRERMIGPLGRARSWLVQNNDTIMSVVFVVLALMTRVGPRDLLVVGAGGDRPAGGDERPVDLARGPVSRGVLEAMPCDVLVVPPWPHRPTLPDMGSGRLDGLRQPPGLVR